MFEVLVSGLAFDSLSQSPVVLLKEIGGEGVLPIWIGPNEAAVIALELSGITPKRPLTHDLMKSVLNGFNARVQRILVSALEENTYFAKFYIMAGENQLIEIDARPSDSIAMALKMESPIFVADSLRDSLLDFSSGGDPEPGEPITGPMDLKSRLRNINPEDFGNFNL